MKSHSKDVLQVVISDTHSGSNFALFLSREWHGGKTSHIPRSSQIKIRQHFENFAEVVRQKRRDKKLVVVHNGDAIDGDHHASGDVCSTNSLEQAKIHVEIMQEFQKRVDWQRGDEIYYTRGTQTHVNEFEDYIADEMNAVMDGEQYVYNFLKLEKNGVTSWFVHHGPTAGKGANEGNPVHNWLKHIYIDALKDGCPAPDIVYTGHVHDPVYDVFTARKQGFVFKNMHGIILPSWQMKTRYAHEVAPIKKNRIGGVLHEIKADGTIAIPEFCVMES